MKTLTLFLRVTIIFFVFQIQANAQPYHPFLENSSWYERASAFGSTSYYWLYKSNDTLISSVNYTIIRASTSTEEYYLREDTIGKQVYLKTLITPEELLYDFSLLPGSVFVHQGSSYLLDSIGSVVTQFGNRNIFYYHNITNFMQATIIEGIGSIEHPLTFKVTISDPVYYLICSYIANTQYYDSNLDTCPPNAFIGVEEINSANAITLFPNPSHGEFIMIGSPINSQIEIFNLFGENIYSTTVNESENKIELKNIAAGIYFVKVYDGKIINSQKLVIQ